MSNLRDANVVRLGAAPFDVLVVGGGINGAVSAACLAARGVRVALVDRGDFAGLTSQQSSNLAWGGIKYLESAEVGLVAKLCRSRNHLIRSYPSTVQEIRFYSVHERGFRRALLLIVLGTWLYWLIGRFFTMAPRFLRRATMSREEPILDLGNVDGGVEYSDAYLHDTDARFVWNFVRRALDYGCVATNYVESLGSKRDAEGQWVTSARDVITGAELTIRARVLVNACGPFVDEMNRAAGIASKHHHAFSKGIHLIVRRLTPNKRVLTFFADDGRPFFVIPMGTRTCIGTTDTKVDEPVAHVTDADRKFVLDNINKRLRLPEPLTPADIIAERCGVRPLVVAGDKPTGERLADDVAQARHRGRRRRPPREHLRRQTDRLPQRRAGGGPLRFDAGRRASSTPRRAGTASPPRRRGWSSCTRRSSWGSTPSRRPSLPSRSRCVSGAATGRRPSSFSRRSAPTRAWPRSSSTAPSICAARSPWPPAAR